MKTIKKKVLAVILLAVVFFECFKSDISAMTNRNYTDVGSYTENAQQINTAMNNSDILNYIAQFVYAVGRVIENLVAKLFEGLTGNAYFPWEDKIIFNVIPILDVNFINPAPHSIFSSDVADGKVGGVVRSVYFTLLTISISLLSVGMAVMGIRLAISSIAAEKAKYKEAIVKAVYTVIMIFSVHFLLSLIFYANELLVETSSSILKSAISDDEVQKLIDKLYSSDLSNINSFVETQLSFDNRENDLGTSLTEWARNIQGSSESKILVAGSALQHAGITGTYTGWTLGGHTFKELSDAVENESGQMNIYNYMGSCTYSNISLNQQIFWYLINNSDYLNWLNNRSRYAGLSTRYALDPYYTPRTDEKPQFKYTDTDWGFDAAIKDLLGHGITVMSSAYATTITASIAESVTKLNIQRKSFSDYYTLLGQLGSEANVSAYVALYADSPELDSADDSSLVRNATLTFHSEEEIKARLKQNLSNILTDTRKDGSKGILHTDEDELVDICYRALQYYVIRDFKTEDIISQLADIFKVGAWTWDDSGKATKYDAIACSLYFILVIQSLMFLFAYIKRLFYVILLSTLGPIVVIYDFFTEIL